MLEIRPLTYFIAAYEEKSISAAATRCFIAQPSISHAIKSLEEKIGQSLFTRSKQGITPTTHGKQLYHQALELLQHAKSIEQSLQNDKSIDIRLFFQGDIALNTLKPIIHHLKNTMNARLHRVSQANAADIAFVNLNNVGKRFQYIPMFDEGFTLLLHQEHHLANKQSIDLTDIQREEFIERPYCSLKNEFQTILKQKGIELFVSTQAENDMQVMDLISLNLGISALPIYRTSHLPKHIVSRPINLDFKRTNVLAYRASRKDLLPIIENINWEWFRHQLKRIPV